MDSLIQFAPRPFDPAMLRQRVPGIRHERGDVGFLDRLDRITDSHQLAARLDALQTERLCLAAELAWALMKDMRYAEAFTVALAIGRTELEIRTHDRINLEKKRALATRLAGLNFSFESFANRLWVDLGNGDKDTVSDQINQLAPGTLDRLLVPTLVAQALGVGSDPRSTDSAIKSRSTRRSLAQHAVNLRSPSYRITTDRFMAMGMLYGDWFDKTPS
jgi:hypothetical protein